MFVNKKVKYKLKRFAWRILKAIVFFGILFSLCTFCFASPSDFTFSSFDEFVGDGIVDFHLRNSSSNIVKNGTFYGSSSDLNSMAFLSGGVSFDSALMTIEDSSNVNVAFSPGDVVLLNHYITLHVTKNSIGENYAKKFTIDINLLDENNVYHELSFRFEDALSSYSISTVNSGHDSIFFHVDLRGILPNFNGTITSIDYHFYDIVSDSWTFYVYPSFNPLSASNESLIFFVGSSQNAPVYSPLDDSDIKDLESSQDELLSSFGDDALGSAGGFFEDFWSSRKGSLSNWLGAASELFSVIYNLIPWQISIVITLFLVFGVLTFTINIVGTILSRRSR